MTTTAKGEGTSETATVTLAALHFDSRALLICKEKRKQQQQHQDAEQKA